MKNKVCIVMSTYNFDITNKIRVKAKAALKKSGINKIDNIDVPGAFEIPVTISKFANKYDGFIAIGCIIKGKTTNFNLISQAITIGIMQISVFLNLIFEATSIIRLPATYLDPFLMFIISPWLYIIPLNII